MPFFICLCTALFLSYLQYSRTRKCENVRSAHVQPLPLSPSTQSSCDKQTYYKKENRLFCPKMYHIRYTSIRYNKAYTTRHNYLSCCKSVPPFECRPEILLSYIHGLVCLGLYEYSCID